MFGPSILGPTRWPFRFQPFAAFLVVMVAVNALQSAGEENHDPREEEPAPGGTAEQRLHDAVVEAGEPVLRGLFVLERERGAFRFPEVLLAFGAALQHADCRPGRDGEGDRERIQDQGRPQRRR